LIAGKNFFNNDYKAIKKNFPDQLKLRNLGQLKDKWRVIQNKFFKYQGYFKKAKEVTIIFKIKCLNKKITQESILVRFLAGTCKTFFTKSSKIVLELLTKSSKIIFILTAALSAFLSRFCYRPVAVPSPSRHHDVTLALP